MPPKKNTKRAKAPSALDRRGRKSIYLTQEKMSTLIGKTLTSCGDLHPTGKDPLEDN